MFKWITRELLVSLQYITRVLTLGSLQISLVLLVPSIILGTSKTGLIYTLVDKVFKINNTTTGRENDLQQLSITLQRNSLPSHLIDKIIKGYKNKFSSRPTQNKTSATGENTTGIRYFKRLFVGDFSAVTRKKLKHLLDVFCKDIDIRIVFSSFKIKNFFQFQRSYSRYIKISGCVSVYLCGM